MRIIKLEIEALCKNYGIRVLRQAVSLDKGALKKIKHFVDYVKKLYNLKGDYELVIDGFGLADNDTVRMLKQNYVYCLKLRRDEDQIEDIGSEQSQEQEQCLEKSDSQENKSKPKNRDAIFKQWSKKSRQIQTKKIAKKVLNQHRKYSQEQEEVEESLSQSSQILDKKVIKARQVSNKKLLVKEKKYPCKQQEKKNTFVNVQVKNKQNQKLQPYNHLKKKAPVQSVSSQSSSSSELPVLTKEAKKDTTPKPQNIKGINNQLKSSQIPHENKVRKDILKRAIIKDSSQQSSLSKSKTPQVKPKKVQTNEVLNIVNQKKPSIAKLPPSLRNRMQANKFEKHQQSQWIVVDKQKYHRWQQLGHSTLCQPPNKIRFRIVQLDEQKFIPIKSGWITGEVTSVSQKGVINLSNVDQQGKQFKKNYQIPQMNMDQLQLYRPLASKQQVQSLLGNNAEQKQKEVNQIQPIKTEVTYLQQPNSVQNFVCGQVNYYFSDKNYLTDCYMQLHANANPQKYMKLSFMLNFPKIKKVLRDEDKLFDYLRGDEKYESRNYEIDFENKLIRKKNLAKPASVQIKRSFQSAIEKLEQLRPQEEEQVLNPSQTKND